MRNPDRAAADEFTHQGFARDGVNGDDLFPAEKHRIAQLLVDQVVVNAKDLTVRLRATGLRNLVVEVNATAATAEERNAN